MAELSDSIEENAKGPKRMKGDSGEAEQHSLPDQIAADKYLRSRRAANRGFGAIKHTKLIPPSAADVDNCR